MSFIFLLPHLSFLALLDITFLLTRLPNAWHILLECMLQKHNVITYLAFLKYTSTSHNHFSFWHSLIDY